MTPPRKRTPFGTGSPPGRILGGQAYAGLLWSEQFYHYVVPDWINGDAKSPLPPEVREKRINRDWPHLFSRDVPSVPDKWEYPAFFAWDLAFHMIPMARIDPDCAKKQLLLLLREWYLHWRDYVLFYEYFDGDTGRGLGASHQTGWTALVASLLDYCGHSRGA